MKKAGLIFYTVIVLAMGAIIGGTVADSANFGKAARIGWGANEVGIAYVNEDKVLGKNQGHFPYFYAEYSKCQAHL